MNLGVVISQRRKSMSLTQEELASKIKVSKSAVGKWETNGGIPERDNLYKLAKVLQIPINELYQIISSNHVGGDSKSPFKR